MNLFIERVCKLALVATMLGVFTCIAFGQRYDDKVFSGLRWRLVGPHRAGRVTAVAGIPGNPAVYYFGTPGGGVWKTTGGGRVWKPIFDDAHVASIGSLALAPSNPEVVYVGTGEETEGNGVYKSIDGGRTWMNIGLRNTHHISSLIVDPKNSDIVLAGALDYFSAGPTHGIFKSVNGGKTWNRVLFKDDKMSVVDMCASPDDPRIVYAATSTFQFDPNNRRAFTGASQIFRSTDEGTTWQPIAGAGMPANGLGRIGVAVAPGSKGNRVYAIASAGFFRSDDAGANWQQTTTDPRVVGSGFFGRTFVDPRNPDVVYVMQTSMYRSTDGGKTFEAYKGAPSGEDQHVLWIDPLNSQRIFLGSDQGAIISLDGGHTWTSWFNQPTGQLYHVITDNEFPYRAYASQQDSGSVAVLSRSDFGQITYRDWFSSGSFESGYIAPDPHNVNLIYSIGWYGSVLRLDRRTGQISTIFAPGRKYRYTWETPLVFGRDAKTLYVGMQFVLKTTDDGKTWIEISPDLTTINGATDQNGVIQTIAPSPARPGVIWVGTSNGLVQLTQDDGAHWIKVSPPDLPPGANIRLIEASSVDAERAYVTAAPLSRSDLRPYIYRTYDAGKTWQKIAAGLPDNATARVVREDKTRKGLLYAGTETGIYVSFDDGDHWQSLQLNLPTTSVRDLKIQGNDLLAATYGRGLWILDDITPILAMNDQILTSSVYLLKPANGVRVRWDNHPDTPLPADTPAGENPPDGAIIYYYLKSPATTEIKLEIRDSNGRVVRSFSSASLAGNMMPRNVPDYWFAPSDVLPTKAGLNRFVWDLHWPSPAALPYSFFGRHLDYIEYTLPDHAVAGKTPVSQPPGPLVVPGTYEIVLTYGGQTMHQPLVVKLDPRVNVSQADLETQLELARSIDEWMSSSYNAYNGLSDMRTTVAADVKAIAGRANLKATVDSLQELDKQLLELQDSPAGFGTINRDLSRFVTMIQSGDVRPARSASENAAASCEALRQNVDTLRKLQSERLESLNGALKKENLATLKSINVEKMPVCTVAD
ncbi:MAG: WD40/YVTN/BNR-like repeat-containing protein [Pyrinomonadaceae bacterium]